MADPRTATPGVLQWDTEAGAGYLLLGSSPPARQRTVPNPVPGRGELVLDFDVDGRLVGVEFLDEGTVPEGMPAA